MYIEFEPGEKHAAKNADTSETLDSFTDAGLLLNDEDVVIDIDHLPKDKIKAMITEFHIKTQTVWTDRGAHLYFRKPRGYSRRKDGFCRLGFEIEQHTKTSRPNGMTIKRNGVPRVMENEGIKQYMPDFFNVLSKKDTPPTLLGLEEGDNRNNILFRFRKILAKQGARNWEKILTFVNSTLFSEPLPAKELEGLMRDTKIDVDPDSPNLITRQIMAEFRTYRYSGYIWWFNGERFVTDADNLGLKHKIYELCPDVQTKFIEEVIKQIIIKVDDIPNDVALPMRFKNGLLKDGKFIKTSIFDEFTTYYIPIDYKPDAKPVKIVDDYIDNLTNGDKEYRMLLLESLGYAFITDPGTMKAIGKFFFFRGDGANGKGTLLEIMEKIFGSENCTNLSIKQLVDDRYKFNLGGKIANLGDDIEPDAITTDQMKVIKNIATADNIACRRLYCQGETVRLTAKLYFTTNTDIKSFEKGYAYRRRVMWLPMFNKVVKPDPCFVKKLTTQEALEYWIRLLIEGYMRIYQTNTLTYSKIVDEYNTQYHENNDVSREFCKEIGGENGDDIHGKTISDIKEDFYTWVDDDRKFSAKNFKAAAWDFYKMGTARSKVGGKVKRVFLRDDETSQVLSH